MKFLITLLLLLAIDGLDSEKIRYDNYKLLKLTPKNAEAVEVLKDWELTAADINFWSSVGPVGVPVEVMVPPYRVSQLENILENLDMNTEVMMENVQDQIDAEYRPPTRDFGWSRYNTLDEINAWLTELAETNPNITLIEGGSSYEGRIIYGIRISYSPANVNSSVFIEANIHAREWITSAVVTYILNELVTSTNETIQQLARSHDWYIFPVFNPDGFVYSHTTDRMWRKTRVPHSILCVGADPNRNWDYFWNHGGTSNSPCTEIYRGPQPFSEPSCRTMANYITSVASRLVAYISFHSFSQLLLIPYGHTPEHLGNYDLIYQVGLRAAEELARRYGTVYTVGNTYTTIYPASGTSSDWVKGTFQTPIVYTYELRDRGEFGFLLPPEQIIPTAEETMDSLITIFEEYYNRTGTDTTWT